jgi:hypothetical protein
MADNTRKKIGGIQKFASFGNPTKTEQTAQADTPLQAEVPAVPDEEPKIVEEPEAEPAPERKPTDVTLPTPRVARRVTRKVPFELQHAKRTISVDRRLIPAFDDLMSSGGNKTVVANQWILKMLLDAGYQIDPDILAQPFVLLKGRGKVPPRQE